MRHFREMTVFELPVDAECLTSRGLSYAAAGVDIDAAHQAMKGVAALVRSTATPDTLSELGSFGGLYRVPRDARQPVLVASTDGVGTKLKVAFTTGRHGTVGEDLVNHCVNDILVQGAKPLFFLDYVGVGRAGAGRRGGAGGGRGARVPRERLRAAGRRDGGDAGHVRARRVRPGGDHRGHGGGGPGAGRPRHPRRATRSSALASSGLHTNGYSLARRIVFDRMGLGLDDAFPEEDGSVADVLLRVHKSYLRVVVSADRGGARPRAGAHHRRRAGGQRAAHPAARAWTRASTWRSWTVPPLFRVLQREGGVERDEMFRAFNMGVGMVAVVAADDADAVVRELPRRASRHGSPGKSSPATARWC